MKGRTSCLVDQIRAFHYQAYFIPSTKLMIKTLTVTLQLQCHTRHSCSIEGYVYHLRSRQPESGNDSLREVIRLRELCILLLVDTDSVWMIPIDLQLTSRWASYLRYHLPTRQRHSYGRLVSNKLCVHGSRRRRRNSPISSG
jgi:hypothetical protein